jgi:hypothetical protein
MHKVPCDPNQRRRSRGEALAALIERGFERNRVRAKRYKLIESAVQSMLGRMKKQGHRGPAGNTRNGHDWRAASATDTKGKSLGEGHTRPEIYDRDGYTAPLKCTGAHTPYPQGTKNSVLGRFCDRCRLFFL